MKTLNKILSFCFALALIATVTVAGTLAYETLSAEEYAVSGATLDITLTKSAEESILLPGVKVIRKVEITNSGTADAYVRFLYAIPEELGGVLTVTASADWTKGAASEVQIDGNDYIAYTFVYNGTLTKNVPAAAQCEIVPSENMDYNSRDGYFYLTTDGGIERLNVTADSFKVYVEAQVVQCYGFASAADAFSAAQLPVDLWLTGTN